MVPEEVEAAVEAVAEERTPTHLQLGVVHARARADRADRAGGTEPRRRQVARRERCRRGEDVLRHLRLAGRRR